VADGGDADSMLQFQLERGGHGMKHYRKMQRRQRAYLGSMERKHDMTRRNVDVSRRRGIIREGK
jgi:hypothetical protein